MTCPYLEYRSADEDRSFDHDRPYCTAAGTFVQPMRADICNGRYGLSHDGDCEIYREHGAPEAATDGGSVGDGESEA